MTFSFYIEYTKIDYNRIPVHGRVYHIQQTRFRRSNQTVLSIEPCLSMCRAQYFIYLPTFKLLTSNKEIARNTYLAFRVSHKWALVRFAIHSVRLTTSQFPRDKLQRPMELSSRVLTSKHVNKPATYPGLAHRFQHLGPFPAINAGTASCCMLARSRNTSCPAQRKARADQASGSGLDGMRRPSEARSL
jgi:hypothetical protein